MHQWTWDADAAALFFRQPSRWASPSGTPQYVYEGATWEELAGCAMGRFSRRKEVVLTHQRCTEVARRPGGLSRRAILEQLDDSLRQLGADYVDVHYIHRVDHQVPVEETMAGLRGRPSDARDAVPLTVRYHRGGQLDVQRATGSDK